MSAPDLPFGICEFSTLGATFEEDLAAYAAAGAEGIGICELKLENGREGEQLAAFRRSGLAAGAAIPAVPSLLPLPLLPGPADPEERLDAIVAGMRRLAPFAPSAFVCLTGPAGELDEARARRTVVAGLRALADEAGRLGVPLGVEPMNAAFREQWTLVTTLDDAAALADEAGGEGLGLVFDTWHLWDAPDLEAAIARHGERIVAVHVSDWREPTRSWCDRVLPGEGASDLAASVAALHEAGWRGLYELEVFSDDGAFGDDYPDSLWKLDPAELARRGRDAFHKLWREAGVGMRA